MRWLVWIGAFAEQTCFVSKLPVQTLHIDEGGVAHRLEQAAHNHLVVGSIPTTPTST